MPLNFTDILKVLPSDTIKTLKKFVTSSKIIIFDTTFKLSTKYTPALIVAMMCLIMGERYNNVKDIHCRNTEQFVDGLVINDYCWMHGTYLVRKGLLPEARKKVPHPGIISYDPRKDEILILAYYNRMWMILIKVAAIFFSPYYIWKITAVGKIRALTDIDEELQEDERVSRFLTTVALNYHFGLQYFACKILALGTLILSSAYLVASMGKEYLLYGWKYAIEQFENDPWPLERDLIFPKTAKCNYGYYTGAGDLVRISVQCDLPLNNMAQWVFLTIWYWIAFVLLASILSCLNMMISLFLSGRRESEIRKICRTIIVSNVNAHNSIHSNDFLHVQLSFGNWIVLWFLRKNLKESQFIEFLKELMQTPNNLIYYKTGKMNPDVVDEIV